MWSRWLQQIAVYVEQKWKIIFDQKFNLKNQMQFCRSDFRDQKWELRY